MSPENLYIKLVPPATSVGYQVTDLEIKTSNLNLNHVLIMTWPYHKVSMVNHLHIFNFHGSRGVRVTFLNLTFDGLWIVHNGPIFDEQIAPYQARLIPNFSLFIQAGNHLRGRLHAIHKSFQSKNIATGETSQAITPFHFFDNFNFHH